MDDPTCITVGCLRPVQSRGLCNTHYNRAWKEDQLDVIALPKVVKSGKHKLSAEDTSRRIADCAECGPRVRIRPRSDNHDKYQCAKGSRGRGKRPRKVTPEARRRSKLKEKYGLTVEQYQIMFEAQQGKCLICCRSGVRLVVDHCHATDRVRGLLCHGCNLALGFLKDNPLTLIRAVKYLKRYA